ncbi:MAG: hypothetical protein ACRD2R_02450, partial [Terriglobales bacterium]
GYALSRVAVTRNDSGAPGFNYSLVLGSLASAGLSNAYYPESDRSAPRTLRSAGLKLAVNAGVNVLKEFLPDLRRKRKKQHRPPASPEPAL